MRRNDPAHVRSQECPGIVPVDPELKATKAEQERAARNAIAQGISLARLEAQEIDREHGRDIFQEDVAPDGQIASISAQGILPCTKKQFDSIASWGMKADFPIAVRPANSQASSSNSGATGGSETGDDSSGKSPEAKKAAEEARARRRPAPPEPPIYIEGDDAIMLIDASNGIIETRDGKALITDKSDTIFNALKGRDFPIPIHYRCDQAGNCTIAGVGTGVHHERLRR